MLASPEEPVITKALGLRLTKVAVLVSQKLLRELEKKFSGKHVCIIAQRRILPREVPTNLSPNNNPINLNPNNNLDRAP